MWSDCVRSRSNREFKTKTVGKVPPYLSKHFPRTKDNIVGNHVIQCHETSPQDNRRHECGCMGRYGSWCRCPTNNERSGHNPTGASLTSNPLTVAQCIPERDRIIELSWRTNDWCSIKTSRCCPLAAVAAAAGTGGCCPVGSAAGCCPSSASAALRMPQYKRTNTITSNTSNTRLFCERENEVANWREALRTEFSHLEADSRKLQEKTWELENCLQATDVPLAVNAQCLTSHQKRLDSCGWYNEVEETLCQEKNFIFKCRERMDDLLARAHAQILRNCEVGRALTLNLSKEHLSKSIDLRQHPLKFNSTRLGLHPGIAETNSSVCTPEVWERSVRENVSNCRDQRDLSTDLCDEIDRYIRGSHNEMWHRTNVVNNSFNARVKQITTDRARHVTELNLVNAELREMGRTLPLMRRSVGEKEAAKKLATARVLQRERILSKDFCTDSLLNSMKNDARELCNAETVVKNKMADTENKLVEFRSKRDMLEKQISVIDHELIVDTNECMPLRQLLVVDSKGGPLTKLSYY